MKKLRKFIIANGVHPMNDSELALMEGGGVTSKCVTGTHVCYLVISSKYYYAVKQGFCITRTVENIQRCICNVGDHEFVSDTCKV